jgi:hypothetical protein
MAKERAGLFVLLGLTGLGVGAAALASASSRNPSVDIGPGRRIPQDWSGCGKPPEYIRESPRFACQQWVEAYRNNSAQKAKEQGAPNEDLNHGPYQVSGRHWGPVPDSWLADNTPVYTTGKGEWDYILVDSQGKPAYDGVVPEYWLKVSSPPAVVKQVAQVLAPTATPATPKTVASAPVKATVAPVTAQQEAAMDLPLYPQGLIVSKGSVEGVVVAIGKQADGYHYKIKAGLGPFQQDYSGSESYVMNMLAEKTGQKPYGFAFPAGVTLKMKGYKVNIIERKLNNGVLSYGTDQGDITEPALIVRLYQAQRG